MSDIDKLIAIAAALYAQAAAAQAAAAAVFELAVKLEESQSKN